MQKTLIIIGVVASAVGLSGCAATNQVLAKRTITAEHYRIFEIKTDAGRSAISNAASAGLRRNVNAVNENSSIPTSADLPEKPGRFKLTNPFEGTRIGALAAASGQALAFKLATCEGSAWMAKANRTIRGQSDLQLTVCVWPFKGGYHIDMYGTFTKEEGGLMQVSREMASGMVGTPEEWAEKTFLDVIRSVKQTTGGEIRLIEGQPDIKGTPWNEPLGVK
jgi:hypothetical protein